MCVKWIAGYIKQAVASDLHNGMIMTSLGLTSAFQLVLSSKLGNYNSREQQLRTWNS